MWHNWQAVISVQHAVWLRHSIVMQQMCLFLSPVTHVTSNPQVIGGGLSMSSGAQYVVEKRLATIIILEPFSFTTMLIIDQLIRNLTNLFHAQLNQMQYLNCL